MSKNDDQKDSVVSTLKPRQNGWYLVDDIFKMTFLMKIIAFWFKFHRIFFRYSAIYNKSVKQANICTNDGVGYQCIYSSLGCNELIKILIKQSEAEKKYPPFCRRNFQILIHCMNSVVLWLSLYSHKTCILIIKSISNACLKFYKDKMPRATRVEQVGSHDDVIKWKLFPRYWPCARGIHRSPVNSPHKGQWPWALIFLWSEPE